MATPTAINLEVFELYKRVKAIDPTLVTGLEGSYLEIYKGELDHLERMYVQGGFGNKVAGSTVANPHKSQWYTYNVLIPNPTVLNQEINQTEYDNLKTLNGILTPLSSAASTYIAQNLFSFNILELLERRYGSGVWKGATTLADKLTRMKAIVTMINLKWYGYGSSPLGNKAILNAWTGSSWATQIATHINPTVTLLSAKHINSSGVLQNSSDGFCHWLVNAEASNGTVASVINTDYIQLEVIVDHSKL